MRTVYVAKPGATLRRNGGLLQVFEAGKNQADIPVHDLGQLVLMGNVGVTPSAMDLLLEQGVDTVFLSHSGRYRGRIVGRLSGNVQLRLEQLRKLADPVEKLRLAKTLVWGKTSNARELLLRNARRHGVTLELAKAELAMRAARERLGLCATLDEVRGTEGSAAAAYFRAFGGLVFGEGFSFSGRNRRPPMDPVNAMLSLGYTLLTNAVEASIEVVGLDPYVGALHEPASGRPSLACDLVEEFRAVVVDALVLAAVNRGEVKPADFEDGGPGEPVVMKRGAVKTVVGLFERRMGQEVLYPPLGKRLAWRMVIEQQVRRFARDVLGEETYGCWEAR